MTSLDRQTLETLIADHGPDPRVSIYLPTVRTGREIRQGAIRLKNLLTEAQQRLQALGVAGPAIEARLAPANDLLERTGTWEHQLDGLALLIGPDGMREFRCPRHFDELCYVNDHFHLKPLLPLLTAGETFTLLALSLNRVTLHEGTRDGLAEVVAEELPDSLPDALGHELDEPSLQAHSASHGGFGTDTAIFHGQGRGEDDREAELTRFLQLVDDGLRRHFAGQRPPVVLAGVEKVVHKFRHVAKYDALAPGAVLGNPDSLGPQRLHADAWEIARPVLEADAEQAVARLLELKGTALATDRLDEIGPAAVAGRVETLFVAADQCIWGRFAADGAVEVHAQRRDDSVDLLDRLSVLALQRGATVHARRIERLPDAAPISAVMRY